MQIAILLFDNITILDAVGPYEVLSRIPDATVTWVSSSPGPKKAKGGLTLLADRRLGEVPAPQIVLIPGGSGVDGVMREPAVLEWIRNAHRTSLFTAAVCTGSLVLGAAGLLKGLKATTHWNHRDRLAAFGVDVAAARVVREGKIVTAAGVSAGIDMALCLVRWTAGDRVAQAIQLGIEYDPDPPFDSGSPEKAPPEVLEMARKTRR
ncbi:MAG: Isonitrile hydratase [Syntrophaceae bacterium PtaB.Bin038]|jgi:transcriptional regulator GlxA family with amidase domain|nr:MAG: Isonitrile hydratase [Syntrophaceae bacterium PtaB.Bin038]